MKTKINFLMIFIAHTTIYGSWHDRKAEGWAWYEERKLTEEKQTPATEMSHIRQALEEKLSAALLDPKPENVKAYMEEQHHWMERSSRFAYVWAQLLLQYPHLDYTARYPISQYGLQAYKEELLDNKEHLIAALAASYGLFYFYAGEHNISSLFAPIVQRLSEKYHFDLIAISMDGHELDGFESKHNNGIAKNLGVDLLPALYLIDPQENQAIPIAFGPVALDQIETNIYLQFT